VTVTTAACGACGSPASSMHQRAGFRECGECGFGERELDPGSGAVVNERAEVTAGTATPTMLHREQLRIAAHYVGRDTQLIDFGCSNGAFLFHARRALGVTDRSYGVEVSPPNVAAALRAGLRVEPSIADIEPHALVTLWHSAEHLPVAALVDLLIDIRQRAGDDSTLLISVPNGMSCQSRWLGRRWAYHDADSHFTLFSRSSLDAVASRAGWREDRAFRTPVYGAFGATQSALNVFRPHNELYRARKRGELQLNRRQVAATGLAALVAAPIAAGLLCFEVSTRFAAVLTVAFRPG
jgi:hypothetical protein